MKNLGNQKLRAYKLVDVRRVLALGRKWKNVWAEIKNMTELNHPNVVKQHDPHPYPPTELT